MEYDLCKWYADKGDTVWYINHYGEIVSAAIIERDVWKDGQEDNPDFFKRYWIKPSNLNWWEVLWDGIRFVTVDYFMTSYQPNGKWPGHSVELGMEIFLTKEEAE